MKIAIYLGSFNPFHKGHLECIKKALRDYKMDEVVIVPTMQNPWKKEEVLDIDVRIAIINCYLFQEWIEYKPFLDKIDISDIEKELIPPYYSYATLHALKNKYCNDEIFVLCGEDTINDIPNWMNGEQIIKDYDFLVVDRPEDSISSTKIRELLKSNASNEELEKYVSFNINLLASQHISNNKQYFFDKLDYFIK